MSQWHMGYPVITLKQRMKFEFFLNFLCLFFSGSSSVAIDNKIEQAMVSQSIKYI